MIFVLPMRNDFTNASDMPTFTGWYLRSVMAETWTGICNIVLWLVIISTSYIIKGVHCVAQSSDGKCDDIQ